MCSSERARPAARRLAALAACLPLLPGAVAAEDATDGDTSLRWLLGLSAQLDDESNDGRLATFDLGLGDDTWLSFTTGRSRSEGAGVVADVLEVALDHRFGLVGLTVAADRWGDSSELQSDDRRAMIYFQGNLFRVGLERVRRDIDIYYTLPPVLGRSDVRTAGLRADGTGLTWRLGAGERWQLYGSWIDYDYSRNLALLPRIESLNLLSTSALTLANSFLAEAASLGVEWPWRDRLLSLGVRSDRSAIDGSRFKSVDAAFLFPVGRRLDLEINLGHTDSDVVSFGLYGGVLVLLYGGP